MSNLVLHSDTVSRALVRPEPRSPITIRQAISRGGHDLQFIDALQKKHSKQVGWMSSTWLETNIRQGNILIAQDEEEGSIGYVLYKDKYLKHEDLGICYQLNVAPTRQRGLIGAALIKAAFERCPYGVKLFCCWCAQDIEANHFWESIGFVPLAFRAGSRGLAQGGKRKDGRIHIFWQRRIREGDTETPYWYPSETSGGALKENRIVLPIPPGTHWSDAKPMVVPGMEKFAATALPEGEQAPKPKREKKPKRLIPASVSKIVRSGLRFGPIPTPVTPKAEKPKREKQPPRKNDPKLLAAAREFRDRYLDEVNSGRCLPAGNGKYDVSRQLAAAPSTVIEQVPLLNAA